jgi:hypothetical protein
LTFGAKGHLVLMDIAHIKKIVDDAYFPKVKA